LVHTQKLHKTLRNRAQARSAHESLVRTSHSGPVVVTVGACLFVVYGTIRDYSSAV